MKHLHQFGFKGPIIPDHIPSMAGDSRVGTAYTIAYMKAMLQRAEEEDTCVSG